MSEVDLVYIYMVMLGVEDRINLCVHRIDTLDLFMLYEDTLYALRSTLDRYEYREDRVGLESVLSSPLYVSVVGVIKMVTA